MVQWSGWKYASFLNEVVKIAFFEEDYCVGDCRIKEEVVSDVFNAGDCRIDNVVVIIKRFKTNTRVATIYCDATTSHSWSCDCLHFHCQLLDQNKKALVTPGVMDDGTCLHPGESHHIKQSFTFDTSDTSLYDRITGVQINIGG